MAENGKRMGNFEGTFGGISVMRFTERFDVIIAVDKCGIEYHSKGIKCKSGYDEKLCQLEDAEELCEKIVSQPIYEKYDTGEIHKEDYTEYHALYNFKERKIEVYGFEFINWFELDEYGKTWALTKEELL